MACRSCTVEGVGELRSGLVNFSKSHYTVLLHTVSHCTRVCWKGYLLLAADRSTPRIEQKIRPFWIYLTPYSCHALGISTGQSSQD